MPRRRGLSSTIPWLGSGLAALAVFGTSAVVSSPDAKAGVDSFYTAGAKSDLVDGYFSNSTIPGGISPEGGGPETDVAQSSLDKGDANASFPYFGPYVATAPGVVSGLFGFPVPPYPLTASSTFGSDPAHVNYPGIQLDAVSRSTSTVADGIVGTAGSGGVSHSEVDESPDGNITALATASSPLTVLGPLVSVKGVDSSSAVTADVNGTLTRATHFSIDEIDVPGLVLQIPNSSPGAIPIPFPVPIPNVPAPAPIPVPSFPVPNGGTTLVEPKIGFIDGYFVVTQPFPGADGSSTQKYVVPADAVVQAFKAQGVTLAYTAPQQTANGVQGGVFTVNYTFPAAPDNPLYKGTTPATFILGSTSATVQRAAATAGGATGAVTGGTTGAATTNGAVPAGVTPGAAAVPPTTDLAGIAALPATTAGGVPTVNLSPQAATGRSGVTAALVAAGLPAFVSSDFSGIYLALIGLTLIGLLAAAVLGAKGVSARWNS